MHRTPDSNGARLLAFHQQHGIEDQHRDALSHSRVALATPATPPRRSALRLIAWLLLGAVGLIAYEAALVASSGELSRGSTEMVEVAR
jgi:hypothetical protein